MKTTKRYGKKADLALSMWVELTRASSIFWNTTVVIDNLEKEGLVEQVACPGDRRAINVRLTAKGEFEKKSLYYAQCLFSSILRGQTPSDYATEAITISGR